MKKKLSINSKPEDAEGTQNWDLFDFDAISDQKDREEAEIAKRKMIGKTPDEIAFERINEAAETGATSLDLSSLGLRALPIEVGELSNLTNLDIADNKLTSLPKEIGKLTKLTKLIAAINPLKSLPSEIGCLTNLNELNLFHGTLTTLPPEIGELSNLTDINLIENLLTSLPPEFGKLTKLTSLEFYDNKLSVLPSELFNLVNIKSISLGKNKLTTVNSKIKQFANLLRLDLSENEITELPIEIFALINLTSIDLSGNKISKLPDEIGKLRNLISLKLNNNALVDLPASIGSLSNLTSLDLSNNKISNLPPEIGGLFALQGINLEQNPITELPPSIENLSELSSLNLFSCRLNKVPPEIGKLTNLYSLNLYHNELQSLPPEIGNLKKLSWLDISDNKLSELPLEFSNLKKLSTLYIEKNPLIYPVEILDTFAPQELVNYIQRIKDAKPKPINEVKIIFVGEASVGKTSLMKRVVYDEFSVNQEKTDGIFISRWQVKSLHKTNNENVIININAWDFGGQEIMHSTHQFFLTKRSLYLLVIDARNSQEQNQVEYWLKIIQSFGGESPVLIVGNKIDQHPLDIDRTGLKKKYPNIVGILETSAATGAGIEELIAAITEQVNKLPHVRDLLPETWFTVKTKLEELGRQSNFITHDKYLDLCAENEVSDETSQRTLIGFMHDLGVVLYFQEDRRLSDLGILNPQWVTNGVYKILNSHTLFQNKGVLTVSMLDEILNLPEYPRGKRLFIVDMMKKFELCYDIEPDKTFLVPDLLPKDEPAELKFNGVPAFEYAYPVLPSSVITRFIVRMNQKIDDGFVWRTGVVLKIGDNKALVKADIEDRKITIAIDGLEHTRRDALSAIRYQLDEIHGSIKGLDAQKRVPIPNAPNAEPLEYEYLLMLEREGDETCRVKDGSKLVTVNVRQILSGIETESVRKEVASRVINIYGDVKDSNILTGDENEVNK